MRRIRAIVYGVGKVGKLVTRYMVEKGVQIVGAIDTDPGLVGRDLGEAAGLARPLQVKIQKDAEAVLSKRADIAIVAVFSDLERMYPIFTNCLKHDLNVLTTAGGSSYNWSTHPDWTSKLDKLAKRHQVTITATGYQDSFMVNLVGLFSGASHTISSVAGLQRYNLDQFGPTSIEQYGAGITKAEFDRKLKREPIMRGSIFNRVCLENIIASLGLTLKKVGETVKPLMDDTDVESKTLGKIIPRGLVTGMAKTVKAETEEGIRFEEQEIAKIYNRSELAEGDVNEWWIKGLPEIHFRNDKVPSGLVTCTQVVNRIPDVINAPPGYISVDQLPKLVFRKSSLEHYIHPKRSGIGRG